MKKLTKKQVEIMKIFWASEHPLAASDILKLNIMKIKEIELKMVWQYSILQYQIIMNC